MATNRQLSRRQFLKGTAATGAALAFGVSPQLLLAGKGKGGRTKRVIVIGFDGMDPRLCGKMMNAGRLPNLKKLANTGGYRTLGTSIPPQSPVAWANFINGAGPGTHGIFDFIHRDYTQQCVPFFSASQTLPGDEGWTVGGHRLHLDFWPFNDEPPKTVLKREGTPFWDYLDKAGVDSTFYNLPSNYPPSKSKHGHHRCLSGLGTPDLLGTYSTYQVFHDDPNDRVTIEGGGERTFFYFEGGTSNRTLTLRGPMNSMAIPPTETDIEFRIHCNKPDGVAGIDIQGQRILLEAGKWSEWITLDFVQSTPGFLPNVHVSGICRLFLKSIKPNFVLYVSPINIDPSDPATRITEPKSFITDISDDLGLFHTTGFQEAHNARSNDMLSDSEYADQTEFVLQERLELLNYATGDYDDGVLFFYFSSTDLQAHMFWWDSDERHPVRSADGAAEYMEHMRKLYVKMDRVVGDIVKQYGKDATVIVMSDHGFCNFKRQFNVNTWLRDNGYLGPAKATDLMKDVDWAATRAYGMGINGLYLNLHGRETRGIVPPQDKDALLDELVRGLKAVRDSDGRQVIRNVHRTDKVYAGNATLFAPDLIVGYSRDYRASWDAALGGVSPDVIFDNDSAWSADHCADVSEVPGVLFTNRPLAAADANLTDIAPSILTEFGLAAPAAMTGKDIFKR